MLIHWGAVCLKSSKKRTSPVHVANLFMRTLILTSFEVNLTQTSPCILIVNSTSEEKTQRSQYHQYMKKNFFSLGYVGAYSNSRTDALVPHACRRRGKKFLFRGWTTGRLFKHFSDLCTASKSVCVCYPLTFSVCAHLSMWVYQTYLVHKPMLRQERRQEQIFGEWNGFLPSLPLQKQSK